MQSSATSWVLDANLAVWAFVPGPRRAEAAALLKRASTIVVPTLWVYEVTSALHKIFWAQPALGPIVWEAMGDILHLPDEIFPPDETLARAAYKWADRLGQLSVYDAFYLALAEQLGAAFWTADRRLYRRARQVGADFVRTLEG